MQVEVIPLTSFVHDAINAREGRPLRMEKNLAEDLEKRGLLRIRTAPSQAKVGKVADDGRGQPSSVSRPAPVSQRPTLHLPKSGSERTRKSGESS